MRVGSVSSVSLGALALAAGLIGGAPALAQERPQPAQASTVSEVVVTAERRTQNMQRAAVAATVLDAHQLEAREVHTVDDLEAVTPSLTISSGGQSNYMNIRGVGKNDNAGNTTSAVATYRDGVGTISGFANGEPYYDIASVEVLRGPQGTFVGENAAGGAIFVNSRGPVIGGGYTGFVELGVANYNEFEEVGAVNLPISDTFAARIAFRHLSRDSFYNVFMDAARTIRNPNDVGAQDLWSGRLSLLWRPTSSLDVQFRLDLNHLDYHGVAFSVVPNNPDAPGANLAPGDLFTIGNNITDNYYVDRFARGALDIHYTFGDGIVLRSITGGQYLSTFFRDDDDGSVFVNNQQNIEGDFRVWTQEVSLVSPADRTFSWILGAYYRTEGLQFPHDPLLTPPVAGPAQFRRGFIGFDTVSGDPLLYIEWNTHRHTSAAFGQVTWRLSEALTLQAGLRYTHYNADEVVDLGLSLPGLTPPDTAVSLGLLVGLPQFMIQEESDDRITGKFAVNWQLNPENYFYAFVATGHTTGGVNVVITAPPTFGPQETTDYEAGWKWNGFGGRLRTQLGGFYDTLDHYQVNFTDPLTGASAFGNLSGQSRVYGLEFTAQGQFDDLGFDVGVALIHSALGRGAVLDPSGNTIQLEGRPTPYTPSATFNAGVQYAFHIGEGTTLTPRVDYAWTAEQRINLLDRVNNGEHFERVPAHALVNAHVSLDHGPWSLTAYVTNIANLHYIQAASGPGYNAYANDPRRFGLRLRRDF